MQNWNCKSAKWTNHQRLQGHYGLDVLFRYVKPALKDAYLRNQARCDRNLRVSRRRYDDVGGIDIERYERGIVGRRRNGEGAGGGRRCGRRREHGSHHRTSGHGERTRRGGCGRHLMVVHEATRANQLKTLRLVANLPVSNLSLISHSLSVWERTQHNATETFLFEVVNEIQWKNIWKEFQRICNNTCGRNYEWSTAMNNNIDLMKIIINKQRQENTRIR